VAMALLYGGLVAPPAAQAGGAGSLATNFVGRFYFNPTTLQGFVVGYLPDIAGVAGPLFNGGPSEATAYFTFRSDVFQFTELPTNGDLQLFLLSAGTYAIYFNPHRAVQKTRGPVFGVHQLHQPYHRRRPGFDTPLHLQWLQL
jgi:hypothetical protein